MDPADQIALTREFMLRIAPEFSRHKLHLLRDEVRRKYLAAATGHAEIPSDDHLSILRAHAAAENARATLEWAMHLAAVFASCQDSLHEALKTDPKADPVKAELEKAVAVEREAQGSAAHLSQGK